VAHTLDLCSAELPVVVDGSWPITAIRHQRIDDRAPGRGCGAVGGEGMAGAVSGGVPIVVAAGAI